MGFTYDQQKAIDFFGNDLLISAAAGSGKTTTLIKKITESIKNGADVSRMLVVTFTKAAANELKTRLTRALTDILKTDKSNAHISSQLLKVGSADICTIDSFCIKLLRPNFDKAGIDADFRIGEESEIGVIRTEAMEDVIDAFYEKEDRDEDFFTVCDCFGSMAREEALPKELLTLYGKLVSTADSIELLLKNNDHGGEFLKTSYGIIALDHIRSFTEHFAKAYDFMIEECRRDEKTVKAYLPTLLFDLEIIKRLKSALESPSYEMMRKILFDISFADLGRVMGECCADTELIKNVRKDFKTGIAKISESYFASDAEAVRKAFAANENICRAIYRVLNEFEKEFTKRKKAYGVCDFNDVERYALGILYNEDGTRSKIALDWEKKYDTIYIDEYQDTNSVQDKIFSAISKSNRFMVGDIKQSIYKFRSAEPEIFAHYRNTFTPMEKYRDKDPGAGIFMSENFRSDKGVIEFSNLVSDYVFKNSAGIPYDEKDRLIYSKTENKDVLYENAEIYLVPEPEDGENENVNPEAELVADKIKELTENGYLENGEKVRPHHIAILLRSKTAIDDYIKALDKRGVYSEYISEERFFERSEILLVLSLLNVMDSVTRDVYLAGALMSSVFCFTLEELVRIRRNSKELPSLYASCKAYSRDDEIREKLEVFFTKIDKYRQKCRRMPTHEIIAMLYAELGIMNGAEGTERKSLIRLYDMARRYEGTSYKGLSAFLRYVDKISSESVKEEIASSDSDRCVKIMTVHASKGLEFEYCFLCEAAKKFNTVDTTAPILFERRLGVSGFISQSGGLAKYNTVLRKCAARAIREAGVCEEMRVLYVAITRARHKMIVTAKVKDPHKVLEKKRKEISLVSEYSVMNETSPIMWILGAAAMPKPFVDIYVADGNQNDTHPIGDTPPVITERSAKIEEILRKRLSFEYPHSHLNKIPSKLSVSKLHPLILDGTENDEIDLSESFEKIPSFLGTEKAVRGADVGIATHLFMQFCDFGKLGVDGVDSELSRLCREGFISEDVSRLVNKRHIEMMKDSELYKIIMGAKRIIREFRFNVLLPARDFSSDPKIKDEKVLVQGVTDCIVEDVDGKIILIDYKTDKVSKENYREILISRHRDQLMYYKKACEMMLDKPIEKMILYSIPLAENVEITDF